MADGVVNTEGVLPNNQNTEPRSRWGWLKFAARRFVRKEAPKQVKESVGAISEVTIPADSGYATLTAEMAADGKGEISRSLEDLYPNFLSMLTEGDQGPDGKFAMKITKNWSFGLDQSTRNNVINLLNAGDKKVVAILAYYLGEKARGSLPLKAVRGSNETMVPRNFIDQEARNLMWGLESQISKDEGKFSAEGSRGKLKDLVIPKPFVDSFKKAPVDTLNPSPPPPSQK